MSEEVPDYLPDEITLEAEIRTRIDKRRRAGKWDSEQKDALVTACMGAAKRVTGTGLAGVPIEQVLGRIFWELIDLRITLYEAVDSIS